MFTFDYTRDLTYMTFYRMYKYFIIFDEIDNTNNERVFLIYPKINNINVNYFYTA